MWGFKLNVYQNRIGEMVLMSSDEPGPILWDFGVGFHDVEWTWVCEL